MAIFKIKTLDLAFWSHKSNLRQYYFNEPNCSNIITVPSSIFPNRSVGPVDCRRCANGKHKKKSCCNTRASSSKPTIVWTHRQPITKRFLLQLCQSKGPRKTPTINFNHLQLQFQWILHQLMIMCRIKEGIFTPRLMGGSRAKIDLSSSSAWSSSKEEVGGVFPAKWGGWVWWVHVEVDWFGDCYLG